MCSIIPRYQLDVVTHLLIPVTHESSLPLVVNPDPKEAEATVALGVGLVAIEVEALRNGGFHLRDRSSCIPAIIRSDAVTLMQNEGTRVHAPFRRGDEVEVVSSPRPRRTNVRLGMGDTSETLPFAGIPSQFRRSVS